MPGWTYYIAPRCRENKPNVCNWFYHEKLPQIQLKSYNFHISQDNTCKSEGGAAFTKCLKEAKFRNTPKPFFFFSFKVYYFQVSAVMF